jgi:protein SCO1/2
MKAYLASGGFPPGVIGLTGAPEEIKSVEKAYRVTASKSGDGDNYTYNHTAVVFLMNPKGQFDSPLMSDITPQQSADQIKDSMKAAT